MFADSSPPLQPVAELDPGALALHPRLREKAVRDEHAELLRRRGWLRIESALAPGLAAEIAALLPGLSWTPQLDATRSALCWRCLVRMPSTPEPQYPVCLYRLGRGLREELPALVGELWGSPLELVTPTVPDHSGAQNGDAMLQDQAPLIDFQVLRKGSYRERLGSTVAAEVASIRFVFGLTGARWPRAWGGHLHLQTGDDLQVLPPGWDTLDLHGPVVTWSPLVTRHVWAPVVAGRLRNTANETRAAPGSTDR